MAFYRERIIHTIKDLREETGVGLKEAKEAVDKHKNELGDERIIWQRMVNTARGIPNELYTNPVATAATTLREGVRNVADRCAALGNYDISTELYRLLLDCPDNVTYEIE